MIFGFTLIFNAREKRKAEQGWPLTKPHITFLKGLCQCSLPPEVGQYYAPHFSDGETKKEKNLA